LLPFWNSKKVLIYLEINQHLFKSQKWQQKLSQINQILFKCQKWQQKLNQINQNLFKSQKW
jgi:hypothetical protein